MYRVTLTDPEAVCNDGSPGVYYIRPGRGADVNNWHIHLIGGFSCGDYETCETRWCDSASAMSSQWTPEVALFEGFTDGQRDGPNPLQDWTHVIVHYCGSDAHRGRAGRVVFEGSPSYGMSFNGADIVDGVLRHLKTASVAVDATTGPLPTEPIPDLDDAHTVVFSGSSAGAAGVMHHADRVRGLLAADNPAVEFRVLLDGGYVPDLGVWLPNPDEVWEDAFDDAVTWHADTDATCLANHVNAMCEAPAVAVTELDAPVFVRQDVGDIVFFQLTAEVLDEQSPGTPLTAEDFADGMTSGVQSLQSTLVSGGEPVGVFGPGCARHVGMTSAEATYSHRMRDESGAHNFIDTFFDWLAAKAIVYAELIDEFAVQEAIAESDPGTCP